MLISYLINETITIQKLITGHSLESFKTGYQNHIPFNYFFENHLNMMNIDNTTKKRLKQRFRQMKKR